MYIVNVKKFNISFSDVNSNRIQKVYEETDFFSQMVTLITSQTKILNSNKEALNEW